MKGEDENPSVERPFRPDSAQLLAHDIRSAMSDVIGGARLIDRRDLSTEHLSQIDRIRSAAELLAQLVDALLEDAPQDTSSAVGNLNLSRFVEDELRRWHGASQGTGIYVTSDRSGNLPEIVQLPLLPLRRVVGNLMSNALCHSGGDRVTLGCALKSDGRLMLCVRDNGRGLPEDVLAGADDVIPGPEARSGMGLHIAAAHARTMGATLTFGSAEMGGAKVTLIIPRAVWSRVAAPVPGDGVPDLRGRRILIADDSGTNRHLAQAMLTRMGAECEGARDGIEALNWLARERFDLALIDVEMPVLGGLDVLRSERLRQARGIAPPTLLIAMTAYVLRDARDVIMEAGADGILAKPLGSIEAFGSEIAHFLRNAPDPDAWAPETAAALSAVMLAELMGAAGTGSDVELLNRLREDLTCVETSLTRALSDEDATTVEAQTHILLSLSSAIGALPTQETARRLNRVVRDKDPTTTRTAGEACLACLAQLRAELNLAT